MRFRALDAFRAAAVAGPVMLLALVPAGCGVFRKKPVPQENRLMTEIMAGTRPLGEIELVNAPSGYVLVRTPYPALVRDESLLVVKSPLGEIARLKVTPEKKHGCVAADITQGTPQAGNAVYFVAKAKLDESHPAGAAPVTADSLPPLNQPAEPKPQWPDSPPPPVDPLPDIPR